MEEGGLAHVAPAAGAPPQGGVSPEDTAAGSPPNRKRSRTDTSAQLNEVRAGLMERGVDGVDKKTTAPALLALLAQHGLITRATFPDPRYWKSGSGDQRNVSKFGAPEAVRGWNAWLDRGETAEQLRGRCAAQEQASCHAGEVHASEHDKREAAAARPSAEKYTARPQRLVVHDRLRAAGRSQSAARFTQTVCDLDQLAGQVAKLHLAFSVANAPQPGAPSWERRMDLMLRALFAVDYVHVTPGLLADHMPDRHYGAVPCGVGCDGGQQCEQYQTFCLRFREKVAVLLGKMLDEHVFGALWDLMNAGVLDGRAMPNDVVQAVLQRLVTSLQMCAPFEGALLEMTETRIREQWLHHVQGERVIYESRVLPGAGGNSGRVLVGEDPPHYSSLAQKNFAVVEGREQVPAAVKKTKRVSFSPAQEARVRKVYEAWEGRAGKENDGQRGVACPRRNSHMRQADKAALQTAAGEGFQRASRLFRKVRARVRSEKRGDSVMDDGPDLGMDDTCMDLDISGIALDVSLAGDAGEADDERESACDSDAPSDGSFEHLFDGEFDSADLSELSTLLGLDGSQP
jgi:hypothetical protein